MSWHEVWHVLVLGSTLLGTAGGVILLLGSFVFDPYPVGLRRARPLVVALVVLALALLGIEWLVVH